ncbi:MAG: phosphoribosylamine-glycine ligase [Gammaproteobacteria bacterium]|jgi:phosphoribosylamine--glycine ligase|nr:phosphoribosylamine-glycine ligase [Gammaproteobacteria bacterium]
MRILIVGSGGREHALAWKAAQSPDVTHVFVAPGNAGTAQEPKVRNLPIDALNTTALIEFASTQQVDLTIIGPEAPLAAGIVDAFQSKGLPCFGPTQKAAQLESSKAFSKAFMLRHGIPTSAYQAFTQLTDAIDYLKTQDFPIVIKADGLAAGKGVVIAHTLDEATIACEMILNQNRFGNAGNRIVIEAFLTGEEASFMVIADGLDFIALETSQDHKARDDGDKGPNTGGMGAYSPAPVVTGKVKQHIIEDIIKPTLAGLKQEGIWYQGFLYAGVMIDNTGKARVLEYNCRLGDPETQPLMMRLKTDLVSLCQASLQHRLPEMSCEWDKRIALGVVMAAGGYPDDYQKGDPITGLTPGASISLNPDCKIFHGGTAYKGDEIITAGGRVLAVCALGKDIKEAQAIAYQTVKTIHWDQCYYRHDIGYRAIERISV